MAALLEVSGLCAGYGAADVLHDVNLQIEEGGITTLLGANGAGKTTTLRALTRMIKVRGKVTLAGERIDHLTTEEIVRRGVAHVPDGRGTFGSLTTEENLRLGGYTRKDRKAALQDQQRMYEFFPRLKERRTQQAGTLSGGEQQMLAIARALMLRPRLLLLDEPSFGLAPLIVREIFGIMRMINETQKVTILLIEQNAAMALDLADQAYLIETGRIAMSGSASALKQDEAVRKAYLGV